MDCGAQFEVDLDRALASTEVDGWIICAENTRHLPLLERLLPLGKPVFCEKPLVVGAEQLAGLDRLLAAHPRAPLISGYFQPWGGQMRAIAQLLTQGALGRVTHASYRNAHHAAYGHWFDKPELAWFAKPELSGGGALLDMGTHAVHLLRSLFGPATRAWGTIANRSGIYPAVEDHGICHLSFANGVLGTAEAAWVHTGGPTGLEICGSEGAIWQKDGKYVLGSPGKDATAITPLPEAPTRVDRLVALMRGELSEDDLAADLAACRDACAIMNAVSSSAATGNWVNVG